ncbi:MAG: SusC/RagA family TonB-linked outer membrane protein [Bacteroidia bacterium]|nr:SusC/RagA family TonB-linked outer membrane protein [Bacteroidia bacterium]
MKKLFLLLAVGLMSLSMVMAQQTVRGTVTGPEGEPLEGASVLVKGTTTGMFTNSEGAFSLSVPEGGSVLVITYVGFRKQEVPISGGSMSITLAKSDLTLDEVVVTGLGIKKEKKALGYGVSTISSSAIENRSEADIARILRGKATGVDITQTSGLAGSGTNVIIRGYSSITGDNQPLFVVDGVPFNTATNNDRGFNGGGATASSRFLDLDPNNIAEVSILKGLSATVLYGEAGRNGVVLITTKNGNVGNNINKKMEVRVSQQVGITEISNLPNYQNSFGNGFSGNFGWFFSNWGPNFNVRGSNGIDENGTIAHPYDQPQFNDDFPEFIGQRYPYRAYDGVENFFEKGLLTNTSVSIESNINATTSVSANYSYLNDGGFLPDKSNTYERSNLGLGARTQLANGITIQSTFNFVDSDRDAPPTGAAFGSGPGGGSGNPNLFGYVFFTPRSIDLMNLPFESPKDGSMVYYRRGAAIENPRWTSKHTNENEAIRRFFGNFNVGYEFTDWLSFNYRIGIDQYNQRNTRTINKGGSTSPDGAMRTTERQNSITDQVATLTYDFKLTEDFALDGIVGLNLRRNEFQFSSLSSTQQFIFDLFDHGNFQEHVGDSFLSDENTIGAYGTATLSYRSFLYVNFQGRNDWTSTLEQENRSIFYPSASVSFIPTEAIAGLQNNQTVNYLKLRFGYGTSAGYPAPYQTRSVLSSGTNTFVTDDGSVLNVNSVSNVLGNRNLEPETITELEVGIEGRFFQNRIGIDVSLYDKESNDLIIGLDLDPATGFTNTTVNAASVENRGIEAGINLVPFQGAFTWSIDANITVNRNKVLKIADGVDQIAIAGFSNLGNFAIPGEFYGIMQGIPFQRNDDGVLLVGADGNYVPGQDIAPIGNPNPNYQANLITNFSFKGFSLRGQLAYVDGGDIYSVSTATMLARGNTVDTDVDRFLPIIQPGVLASDESTPNNIQGYIGDFFFRSYFFADEGTVFDGTTLRLREVSLSYDVPKAWLDKTPLGSISLILAGENLWYKAYNFPEGVNYDPEVLSLGVGNGRGFDFTTGPTSKRYSATLNLTF